MSDIKYYILFSDYTQGLAMEKLLKENGHKVRIAPTPSALQEKVSCGISLMVMPQDIDSVRDCIEANSAPHVAIMPLEVSFNPRRNKFC